MLCQFGVKTFKHNSFSLVKHFFLLILYARKWSEFKTHKCGKVSLKIKKEEFAAGSQSH